MFFITKIKHDEREPMTSLTSRNFALRHKYTALGATWVKTKRLSKLSFNHFGIGQYAGQARS